LTTLSGMFMLVAEDLYEGYHHGFPCVDVSGHNQPDLDRNFTCRVALLLVCGDYPALAKMTGFTHAGNFHCHWCLQRSTKESHTNRFNSGDFRRWLPMESVNRSRGGNFAADETQAPPRLRDHNTVVQKSVMARHWKGTAKSHPGHTHGICDWCPLSVVPNFDIVWDTLGDFMHAVMWYSRHVVAAMKGATTLAAPRLLQLELRKTITSEERLRRVRANAKTKEAYVKAKKV
jgi:hypothetical protein